MQRQLSTLKQNTDVANLPPRDDAGKTRDELALQAEPLIAARAKARQESGINQYSPVANLPQAETGKTRDELAEMAGIS